MLSGFKKISKEEKANVISHWLGFVAYAIVIPFLCYRAFLHQGITVGIGTAIFGITLLTMLMSSTLYHYQSEARRKQWFRIMDHVSIYLLIGGSYTAFILLCYNEVGGWILLGVQWSIIAIGIASKIFLTGKFKYLSTASYLILGWMVLFVFNPVSESLSTVSLGGLLGGGLAYTVGVAFYVWERLPFNHLIWHIFVLAGAFGHCFALYQGL